MFQRCSRIFFAATIAAVALVCAVPQAARATNMTYYVDSSVATSGSGTVSSPWKTMADVNSRMAYFGAGDKILFRRGQTWNDAYLTITASGASGNPITFGSYLKSGDASTKPRPIFTGADSLRTRWAAYSTANVYYVPGVTVAPAVVTRDNGTDDVWLEPGTSVAGLQDYQWFYDADDDKLYLKDPVSSPDGDSGHPSRSVVAGARDHGVVFDDASYVTLDGITIQKANSTGVDITHGSHITINNCVIRLCNAVVNAAGGVNVSVANDVSLTNNYIGMTDGQTDIIGDGTYANKDAVRGDCIYVNRTPNILIQGNRIGTCYHSFYDGTDPSKGGDCIQIGSAGAPTASAGFQILDNLCTMQGTNSPKGCIITAQNNGVISGNVCSHGSFGINVTQGSNVLVERNVCRYQGWESYTEAPTNPSAWAWQAGLIMAGPPVSNCDAITWRYNLVYGCVNGLYIHGAYQRTNLNVLNNTFYRNFGSGVRLEAPVSGSMRNNIVWSDNLLPIDNTNKLGRIYRITNLLVDAGTNQSLFSSTNNMIGPERTGFIVWKTTAYDTLLAIQAAAIPAFGDNPQESNSKNGLPKFENPFLDAANVLNAPNLRLKSTSNAIGSGRNLYAGLNILDLDGFLVPSTTANRVDVGCYEYHSP